MLFVFFLYRASEAIELMQAFYFVVALQTEGFYLQKLMQSFDKSCWMNAAVSGICEILGFLKRDTFEWISLTLLKN